MKTEQLTRRPEGYPQLPSQYQPGDKAGLQTLIDLMERAGNATITKVSFSPGKVKYDLQIPIVDPIDGEASGHLRIANVDSAFTSEPYLRKSAPRNYSEVGVPHLGSELPDSGREVLIDLDARKKRFTVGYFDFETNKWRDQQGNEIQCEIAYMRWMDLPK